MSSSPAPVTEVTTEIVYAPPLQYWEELRRTLDYGEARVSAVVAVRQDGVVVQRQLDITAMEISNGLIIFTIYTSDGDRQGHIEPGNSYIG